METGEFSPVRMLSNSQMLIDKLDALDGNRKKRDEMANTLGKFQCHNKSKMFIVIASFLLLTLNLARATMNLPDGIENILGFVPKSTFQCERDGYFGDTDNDCRIFHLCQKQINPNGRTEWRHWTYACGNQTMFNQLTLTCAFVDEAIPCKHATQFQYLNEVIHKPREPFLTDADVTSGISYYSNRVMSDGARTRAFEDSRLMAQLGGPAMLSSVASTLNRSHNSEHSNQRRSHSSFAPTNPREDTVEDIELDTSGRSANSISSVEVPVNRERSTQSLSHQGNQQRQQTVLPAAQSQNGQPEIIINHSQHFEHTLPTQFNRHPQQSPQASAPEAATFNLQNFQVSQQQHQQQQHQQQKQQQQQQQQHNQQFSAPSTTQLPGGPNLFDFSISTNHQLGPAPNAAVALANQFVSQTAPNRQQQLLPTVAPPPPPPVESTTAQSLQQISPTNFLVLSNEPGPTTFAPLPPLAQTVRSEPIQQPQTTTLATDRTPQPQPQPQAQLQAQPQRRRPEQEQQQLPARGPTREQQGQRQQGQQRNHQPQQRQNHMLFDQTHRPFQSTRLSAQGRQQQRGEPALVMRRQAQNNVSPNLATPEAAGRPASSQVSSLEGPRDFWMRPWDSQFMAPRFESLLTRRRV